MLISHNKEEHCELEHHIQLIKDKLHKNNKEDTKLQLQLLEELSKFDLGRFLLSNKGLNGYWTSYVISKAIGKDNLSELEHWLIHDAPGIRATRERFFIFQQQIKKYLSDKSNIASLPCGLMDDLLTIDYHQLSNIKLTGIDLDAQSLSLAQENARAHQIDFTEFKQENAWHLKDNSQFDILVSNGLNIYEGNEEKLVQLYKNFHRALKPGGILITSFITPSPQQSKQSPWKNVDMKAAGKQLMIFKEIIGVNFQNPLLETEIKKQMEAAGFQVKEVIYDSQGLFPTLVATKVDA